MRELWATVWANNEYVVSSKGCVRRIDSDSEMAVITLQDGSLSVSLSSGGSQRPYMLRRLVAEAFCARNHDRDDTVIHLNGDQQNCSAENLVWVPRWFAWKYTHQFNSRAPDKYNRQVRNMHTGAIWSDIPSLGIHDGVLWADIWRSCVEGIPVYPHGHTYELV